MSDIANEFHPASNPICHACRGPASMHPEYGTPWFANCLDCLQKGYLYNACDSCRDAQKDEISCKSSQPNSKPH